jgi:excisionase family DNA binding protein
MSGDILPAGWLTTEEAQDLTGYSIAHLRRLARDRRVNARKLAGQLWLFERASLAEYKATVRPGPKRRNHTAAAAKPGPKPKTQ